jgi:radical SAM-linked protein
MTERFRYRVRFRKHGDVRWIGHRDLARTLEQAFRRAGINMAMTQGFHPRPKFSFPLALALGVEGRREVMELQLEAAISPDEMIETAAALLPPGLELLEVVRITDGLKKARVQTATYAIEIPEDRRLPLLEAIDRLLGETSVAVQRADKQRLVDIRPGIQDVRFSQGLLEMRLAVTPEFAVRPREVLQALGLEDLEAEGQVLARTDVELAR